MNKEHSHSDWQLVLIGSENDNKLIHDRIEFAEKQLGTKIIYGFRSDR